MNPYHKIQSVYKRDANGSLLVGEFSTMEFEYLSRNVWEFTEKVDGMNIRVMFDGNSVSFGGRTEAAMLPSQLMSNLSSTFIPKVELFLSTFQQKEVCFYGEGYGNKIQSVGKMYSPIQEFVLFDVKVGNIWLSRSDVNSIAKKFNIMSVPVIGFGTLYDMTEMVKSGIVSKWGDFPAEGIVARPAIELKDRFGSRVITKLKTRDFMK